MVFNDNNLAKRLLVVSGGEHCLDVIVVAMYFVMLKEQDTSCL
jgi:hypothetical protein